MMKGMSKDINYPHGVTLEQMSQNGALFPPHLNLAHKHVLFAPANILFTFWNYKKQEILNKKKQGLTASLEKLGDLALLASIPE